MCCCLQQVDQHHLMMLITLQHTIVHYSTQQHTANCNTVQRSSDTHQYAMDVETHSNRRHGVELKWQAGYRNIVCCRVLHCIALCCSVQHINQHLGVAGRLWRCSTNYIHRPLWLLVGGTWRNCFSQPIFFYSDQVEPPVGRGIPLHVLSSGQMLQ